MSGDRFDARAHDIGHVEVCREELAPSVPELGHLDYVAYAHQMSVGNEPLFVVFLNALLCVRGTEAEGENRLLHNEHLSICWSSSD